MPRQRIGCPECLKMARLDPTDGFYKCRHCETEFAAPLPDPVDDPTDRPSRLLLKEAYDDMVPVD